MTVKASTAGAALAPPVHILEKRGKLTLSYLLTGNEVVQMTPKDARERLRFEDAAARGSIAGRWKVKIDDAAAGYTVTLTRKAGHLLLMVSGTGPLDNRGKWSFAWSADRGSKKWDAPESKKGTARTLEAACSAAVAAAMQLEGAVCPERPLLAGGRTGRPEKGREALDAAKRVTAAEGRSAAPPARGGGKKSSAAVPSLFGGRG
jgi:hypothetical protein